MESSQEYSSYWGKLKDRKRISDDIVMIVIASHSLYLFADDPLLPVLRPRNIKRKVFVAICNNSVVHVELSKGSGKDVQVSLLLDVQVTDSYSHVSRLRDFWDSESKNMLPIGA
jgi:hypothetical protein